MVDIEVSTVLCIFILTISGASGMFLFYFSFISFYFILSFIIIIIIIAFSFSILVSTLQHYYYIDTRNIFKKKNKRRKWNRRESVVSDLNYRLRFIDHAHLNK